MRRCVVPSSYRKPLNLALPPVIGDREMTDAAVSALPAGERHAMPASPPHGSAASDPLAFGGYRDDSDDLSERIAAFNRTNDELEAAECRAIALREARDKDADKAQERVDELLRLAIERLNAVFEFQPTTLRSAIALLLCSIDRSCLDRQDSAAVMNTRACARALEVIQEITGVTRKLPW